MPLESENRNFILELAITTISLLLLSRLLLSYQYILWITKYTSTIVAVLFLYTPVVVLWRRGRAIDFLDHDFNGLVKSIAVFILSALIIFPVFFLLAHLWQVVIWGRGWTGLVAFPGWLNITFFQILLIALPEEFYFRGYFQSTIDKVFQKRIKLLGVEVGWGFVITAVVFALAHAIVSYKWWHFSIFFPALLFGYLRLRTGSITAPIFFHAASNMLMDWFVSCYNSA